MRTWGQETLLTKTMWSLRKRLEKQLMISKLLTTNWRRWKIKSLATKWKLKSWITSCFSLIRTKKNTLWKQQRQTQTTISVLSKLSWRTTSSLSSRRKILKLKEDSNNNRTFMKLLDQTETFTLRIFSKPRKKLLSWRWNSKSWSNLLISWRKRSQLKIIKSTLKTSKRETLKNKTLRTGPTLLRKRNWSSLLKSGSSPKKKIVPDLNMSYLKLKAKNRNRRKIMKW